MARKGKFYLHIPMTKDFPLPAESEITNVVGLDFGMNFLVTAYDSHGKTTFFSGRELKNRRAQYKGLRREIQQHRTSLARSKMKDMGSRESRWVKDVCQVLTKQLIERYGPNTLFVIEDLTGIRSETERVKRADRYVNVSWPFYQLRATLEYKVALNNCRTIAVNPAYTSQTCPKCGHIERGNRNKKLHEFKCCTCGYRSNDDRVAAMNLQRMGVNHIAAVTSGA